VPIRANATRQELTRLKGRLDMAKRGHTLLKDKRDQLMKEFLAIVHESQRLRIELEEKLADAYRSFSLARAVLSPSVLEEALMVAGGAEEVSISYRNIMNVSVPEMEIVHGTYEEVAEVPGFYPNYGLAVTSSDLDDAIEEFHGILPLLVRLSTVERTIHLFADEIEKTRRRVNAL